MRSLISRSTRLSKLLSAHSLAIAVFFVAAAPRVWAQGASLPDAVVGKDSAWPAFLKAFKTSPDDIKGIPEIIVGVLNIFLGFLGLFFVVLLTYSGFLWMTAAGDEKQIRKARDYLTYGIIGIFIIIASWSIAWFVTNVLSDVVYGPPS
ncbi:hypothetical protein HYV71_04380 [Candidatus Uhrbacteria bacterium]|nr:hypothetical protein [Candidatus Uhrbacteria bacterium]